MQPWYNTIANYVKLWWLEQLDFSSVAMYQLQKCLFMPKHTLDYDCNLFGINYNRLIEFSQMWEMWLKMTYAT